MTWMRAALVVLLRMVASNADAACNQIPDWPMMMGKAGPSPAPIPTPYYVPSEGAGAGAIDRPFLAPRTQLLVEPATRFATPPAPANLTVMLAFHRPTSSWVDMLIVAQPGVCKDARDACDNATVAKNDVACALGAVDLHGAESKNLKITLPSTDAMQDDLRARSGPVSLIVTTGLGFGPLCGALYKGGGGCATLLREHPDSVVACFDTGLQNLGRKREQYEILDHMVALPEVNDFHAVCARVPALCARTAEQLRYTYDGRGNLLVPVLWAGLFPASAPPTPPPDVTPFPPRRLVTGEVVAPHPFKLPSKDFLQSFSFTGAPLDPKREVGKTKNAKVTSVLGTTDAAYSVVRIRSRRCTGDEPVPCNDAKDCPEGESCTIDHQQHHNDQAPKRHGRVRLDRDRKQICEDDPERSCGTNGACAEHCSQFVLTAAEVTPGPTSTPGPDTQRWGSRLEEIIGVKPDVFAVYQAPGSDALWATAIVNAQGIGTARGLPGVRNLLVVIAPGADGRPIARTVKDGEGMPQTASRVGQCRKQHRFLSLEPIDARAWQGSALDPTRDRLLGVVRVVGDDEPTATIVGVAQGRDTNLDPLAPVGAGDDCPSTFISPGGWCMTGETVQAVPDVCTPGNPGACPGGSTCVPRRVVVAVDFAADNDQNGIPNVRDAGR